MRNKNKLNLHVMAGPLTSCGGNAGLYGVRQAGEPQYHIFPNCYKFTGV